LFIKGAWVQDLPQNKGLLNRCKNTGVTRILVKNGFNVNDVGSFRKSILTTTVEKNDLSLVSLRK